MTNPQLPGYAAVPLLPTNRFSPEWYRYLKWLGERETSTEAQALPEYKLVGPLSIVVSGLLQNGLASLALKNDALSPESRSCYGTDDDGAKGWHLIADALDVTADLTKSVDGTTNVATFGLADLTDSGVGAALVKITRDAKGRLGGTQAATTTDLAEGSNLYYTNARADARVQAFKDAPALTVANLQNAVDDTAAAVAGVAVGELYRNGSVLMIRVT